METAIEGWPQSRHPSRCPLRESGAGRDRSSVGAIPDTEWYRQDRSSSQPPRRRLAQRPLRAGPIRPESRTQEMLDLHAFKTHATTVDIVGRKSAGIAHAARCLTGVRPEGTMAESAARIFRRRRLAPSFG